MENIYKDNTDLVAYILIQNGNLVLDFDETKISPSKIMVALHKFTGEYLKLIDEQQENNKKDSNG